MKKAKYLIEDVRENHDPLPISSSISIDDLPTPILHDILVRLPFKCLQRSKCVSKTWLSHISSPPFAIHHRRRYLEGSLQNSPYRLFVFTSHHRLNNTHDDYSIYSIDLDDSVEEYLPKKILLPPSLEMLRDKYIGGCCNGLLLVVGLGDKDHRKIRKVYLALINPSTGAYREIPSLQQETPKCNTYGLAYDCSTDDYKVIMVGYRPVIGWHIWMYSLRVGSWRWVAHNDQQHHRPFYGVVRRDTHSAVLIDNHLFHWLFFHDSCQMPRGIACFDVCNEQWNDVPLPEADDVLLVNHLFELGVLDGCLCFLAAICPVTHQTCGVMVMKEYGVKESWIKLFNISDSFDVRSWLMACPIAYSRNKTEILLRTDSRSRLFWYNLRDKTRKTVIIPQLENRNLSICTCIQSLAPFPGCSDPSKAEGPKGE